MGFAETWAKRNERVEVGMPEPMADMLAALEQEHADKAALLKDAAERIIERMQRVIQRVEAGEHVNGLGELQGSAPQFDILCAQYMGTAQAVTRATYYAEQVAK